MCIDNCDKRKGFRRRLTPAVPRPTGIIAGKSDDDDDIMEDDRDAVDNVEYKEEEDEAVYLLDLGLVNFDLK